VVITVEGVRVTLLTSEVVSQCAASADLALLFLGDVFTTCPTGAAAAVAHLARLQAFVEGYQLYRAGLRASGVPATPGGGAAPPSGWSWLLGDVRVGPASVGTPTPTAGGGAGGSQADDAGVDAAASDSATASSAWVLHPSWSGAVPDAIESVSAAQAVAFDGVDSALEAMWRRAVHQLRADVALLAPLRALRNAPAAMHRGGGGSGSSAARTGPRAFDAHLPPSRQPGAWE
jgi:hypothetical protein